MGGRRAVEGPAGGGGVRCMGDAGGAREERRQEGGNLPREWGNVQRALAGRRCQELGAYILSHGNEKSREGATRHGNQLHAGDDTGGHTGPARISVERARAKKAVELAEARRETADISGVS